MITLPEDTLQAIGTMMVRFNHLEAVLELVLIRQMGMDVADPKSHIPFANMTFAQRLEILETVLHTIALRHASVEPIATYQNEIKRKLSSVNKRRNTLVHSRWSYLEGVAKTLKVSAKGTLKLESATVTTSFIDSINRDISDAANSLWGLITGDYPYESLSTKGAVTEALREATSKADEIV